MSPAADLKKEWWIWFQFKTDWSGFSALDTRTSKRFNRTAGSTCTTWVPILTAFVNWIRGLTFNFIGALTANADLLSIIIWTSSALLLQIKVENWNMIQRLILRTKVKSWITWWRAWFRGLQYFQLCSCTTSTCKLEGWNILGRYYIVHALCKIIIPGCYYRVHMLCKSIIWFVYGSFWWLENSICKISWTLKGWRK